MHCPAPRLPTQPGARYRQSPCLLEVQDDLGTDFAAKGLARGGEVFSTLGMARDERGQKIPDQRPSGIERPIAAAAAFREFGKAGFVVQPIRQYDG